MANLSPQGPFRAFDADGNPLNGGLLYTYEADSSTPKVTYTDSSAGTENENPVELDANGYANVWLGDGAYKFILKNSAGVTQWSIDNIVGEDQSAFGANVIDQGTNLIINPGYANYFINCTAAITLSLGAAGDLGEGFFFTVRASNGAVMIDPDGGETINGAATLTIPNGSSALIITNGIVWYSAFLVTGDFSGVTLILPQTAVPAQTAEGSIVWDTNDDLLTVGDGVSRKVMLDTTATQTITGIKTFTQNIAIAGSSTEAAYINLFEDTDNGTNKVKLQAPATLASDATITTPAVTGTLATLDGTETLSNKTMASGTAGTQMIKAWCVFDGTTGSPTVTAGYNVASITKNGTGDYTITFTSAMASANYVMSGSVRRGATNNDCTVAVNNTTGLTTGAARIAVQSGGSAADSTSVHIMFIGG